jgi:hypothetical protein
MPEALHMSTLIIAALNLAYDYIYHLTLRIHSNDCDILELCHEIQRHLLYPATPALPRPQEYTLTTPTAMRPDGPRDPTAGPDSGPETPFPLRLDGKVIKGFGRGSKEVCVDFLFLSRASISLLLAAAASFVGFCNKASKHIVSLATLRSSSSHLGAGLGWLRT